MTALNVYRPWRRLFILASWVSLLRSPARSSLWIIRSRNGTYSLISESFRSYAADDDDIFGEELFDEFYITFEPISSLKLNFPPSAFFRSRPHLYFEAVHSALDFSLHESCGLSLLPCPCCCAAAFNWQDKNNSTAAAAATTIWRHNYLITNLMCK